MSSVDRDVPSPDASPRHVAAACSPATATLLCPLDVLQHGPGALSRSGVLALRLFLVFGISHEAIGFSDPSGIAMIAIVDTRVALSLAGGALCILPACI